MLSKYKISSMAKDFNLKNKDVLDILASFGVDQKAHSAVLTPDEFAMIFEKLTRENQIKNMNEYLSGAADALDKPSKKAAAKKEKEVKAAVSEPKAEKAVEVQPKAEPQKAEETKKAPEKAIEKAPEKAPVEEKMPEQPQKEEAPKKAEENKKPVEEKKPEQPKNNAPQVKIRQLQQERSRNSAERFVRPAQQDKPQQKPQQKPLQNDNNNRKNIIIPKNTTEEKSGISEATNQHTKATRIVDTRTSTVDLSKYDEKLDRLAQEDFGRGKRKNNADDRSSKIKKSPRAREGKENVAERIAMEKMRRAELERIKKIPLSITVPDEITVSDLAVKLKVTASEVIKRLMKLGVMATVNQTIDFDTAYLVADELGAIVTKEVVVTIEEKLFDESEDKSEDLEARPPVVVVMGHVDHGKTSLLDAIRNAHVTQGEAGGITQHIGAYSVAINGRPITFLDTPGHEAFTAMRARGAQATDIAILVVAADDGIMPQTVEAINHAKAAGLSIIVAINKMDKPSANPDAIKQGLTQYDLLPEEWGGDTICVPVSAHTKQGIPELLEMVLLVADMKELRANPNRRAKGIVIEAKLDKGRGPVATLLVQNGTLHSGDVVIAGTSVGRVRAMTDERGKVLKTAGPSVPVEIIGLSEVPSAGDEFNAVEDERMARELADQRREKEKTSYFETNARASLDDLFNQISEGVKTLNIIVKADVKGSAEAVKASLSKLSNEEVRVSVIHAGVGGINEGDVMLAYASNAIIIGFGVRPDKNAIDSAERQKVEIRTYRIIYECLEEIEAAMKGMLKPMYREVILGHAQVRQTIHVPNVGTIAGSYVQDGKITRTAMVRVVRDGIVIFEDKISSLRRFKDDVKEVASGYECGVGLEKFNDIKIEDILEIYSMEEIER